MANFYDDIDNLKYDCVIKILLVGDELVGKSNFITRYCTDNFFDDLIPNGVFRRGSYNCLYHDFKKDNITIKQQICEVFSKKIFSELNHTLFRGTYIVGLLFSLTDKKSFINLNYWIEEINKFSAIGVRIILIGTKSDLLTDRVISQESIDEFCNTHGFKYIETSAKNNTNINEAFEMLTNEIINNDVLFEKLKSNFKLNFNLSKKSRCY